MGFRREAAAPRRRVGHHPVCLGAPRRGASNRPLAPCAIQLAVKAELIEYHGEQFGDERFDQLWKASQKKVSAADADGTTVPAL